MITGPVVTEIALDPAGEAALARLASTLAVQAGLDVGVIADVALVVECLVEGAHRGGLQRLHTSLLAAQGRVDMRVGPLSRGGATALGGACDIPGVGKLLERIGGARTERGIDGEYLVISVTQPSGISPDGFNAAQDGYGKRPDAGGGQ